MTNKVELKGYSVELEPDSDMTKVFLFFDSEFVECKYLMGLSPSKEMVISTVRSLIRKHEERVSGIPYLIKLEKEVNETLSNEKYIESEGLQYAESKL